MCIADEVQSGFGRGGLMYAAPPVLYVPCPCSLNSELGDNLLNAGAYRKVCLRLPGKGNSNSQGLRPVHQIISMIKCVRISRLPNKKSLSRHIVDEVQTGFGRGGLMYATPP